MRICCMAQETQTGLCINLEVGMGSEMGGRFKREGIYVYLWQYVNRELPDVQAGFRTGRGTRNQIANIRWIMEKAREFQKNLFLLY